MLKTNQSPGSLSSNSNNNNNILSGGGQHSQLETTHGSKDLSNNSSMTDSPESSVRLLVGELLSLKSFLFIINTYALQERNSFYLLKGLGAVGIIPGPQTLGFLLTLECKSIFGTIPPVIIYLFIFSYSKKFSY